MTREPFAPHETRMDIKPRKAPAPAGGPAAEAPAASAAPDAPAGPPAPAPAPPAPPAPASFVRSVQAWTGAGAAVAGVALACLAGHDAWLRSMAEGHLYAAFAAAAVFLWFSFLGGIPSALKGPGFMGRTTLVIYALLMGLAFSLALALAAGDGSGGPDAGVSWADLGLSGTAGAAGVTGGAQGVAAAPGQAPAPAQAEAPLDLLGLPRSVVPSLPFLAAAAVHFALALAGLAAGRCWTGGAGFALTALTGALAAFGAEALAGGGAAGALVFWLSFALALAYGAAAYFERDRAPGLLAGASASGRPPGAAAGALAYTVTRDWMGILMALEAVLIAVRVARRRGRAA